MPELQLMFKRQLRYILYALAIFFLGWGFTEFKAVFAGLILGTAASTFNVWLLARRSARVGEAAASGRSAPSLGSASRFASALLVAMIAVKYPETFNIYSSVAGLVTAYAVIIIDFFIHKSYVNNEEER